MADYWKSQPRHFCEFCKCWTADNKASRDFHERGKRHQENVQKKLDELRKKGLADAKKEKEMSSYLQQMEKAALSKLKEDLRHDPKLASQYGVVIKSKNTANTGGHNTEATSHVDSSQTASGIPEPCGEWCEATTPEGYVYYWNTVTKESRWELPTSAAEADITQTESVQNDHADEPPAAKKKKTTKHADVKKDSSDEQADVVEKSPDSAVAADANAEATSLPQSDRQARHHSAYGAWQTVQQDVEEQPVDLELPQESSTCEVKTLTVTSEPKIKFREKKVTSLSAVVSGAGMVGFRKSKFGANRSIRSTDCTEDS